LRGREGDVLRSRSMSKVLRAEIRKLFFCQGKRRDKNLKTSGIGAKGDWGKFRKVKGSSPGGGGETRQRRGGPNPLGEPSINLRVVVEGITHNNINLQKKSKDPRL